MMTNSTRLVVLVGLPASGKSTWARKRSEEFSFSQWISSDNIRVENNYNISNEKVFKIMWEKTKLAATEEKEIIYDATNLSSKRRKHLVDKFVSFCEKQHISYSIECIIFLQPMKVLYQRNAKRMGRERVPIEVMQRMLRSFQMPALWEGFHYITVDESSQGEVLPMDKICLMEQDNPHHNLSLGAHLFKTHAQAVGTMRVLEMAALYHDVGKYWTKEFDDKGIAHYYNHENVGAYMVALHFLEKGCLHLMEYHKVIILINYHMRPYVWEKSKKVKEKDKKIFGNMIVFELEKLNKYDRLAH